MSTSRGVRLVKHNTQAIYTMHLVQLYAAELNQYNCLQRGEGEVTCMLSKCEVGCSWACIHVWLIEQPQSGWLSRGYSNG